MQLGFAIIPLIHFVSDKKTMGQFAIKPWLKVASWLITVVLVYLNAWMVAEEISGYFQSPGNIFWKILIVIGLLLIIVLLYLHHRLSLLKRQPHPKISPYTTNPKPCRLLL